MATTMPFLAVPEYGDNQRHYATEWFWQTGDHWVAVVGRHEANSWWDGADPADVAARPDPWRYPIDSLPPSGTLVFRDPYTSQVRKALLDPDRDDTPHPTGDLNVTAPHRLVWVVSFATDTNQPNADSGVCGFDWFYSPSDAFAHFYEATTWDRHNTRYRLLAVTIPSDLDDFDAITAHLDERLDYLEIDGPALLDARPARR